jgi:ribonuclease BN (tRNA processing enzyme)
MELSQKRNEVPKYGTYKHVMNSQQQRFLDYLKFRTARKRNYRAGEPLVESPNFELISLRRWNSFSPNLGSRAAASVGGGYLVRLWAKGRYVGIAIDPGYNFLENLFNEGFTIADIDIIVVTHAHPDHTENLTNLFTLLFERNKRMADEARDRNDEISAPLDHRVFLLLTEGVFERYESMLRVTKTYVRDIVVLKASEWRGSEASGGVIRVWTESDNGNCRIELDSNNKSNSMNRDKFHAVIQATRAWHDDQTGHDSIGVVITYWEKNKDNEEYKVGILGDSKYHKELYLDYADCSVLVAHLGGLISKFYYRSGEESEDIPQEDYEKMIREAEHLYLPGLTRLICDLKNQNKNRASKNKDFPLLVLSEFGEELRGGLRKDLAKRLASGVHEKDGFLPIVPADVGLRIDIKNKRIFCSVCHRHVTPEGIKAESVLPNEEALAFVCNDCRQLRSGELIKLLEEWCTTGRPIVHLPMPRKSSIPEA